MASSRPGRTASLYDSDVVAGHPKFQLLKTLFDSFFELAKEYGAGLVVGFGKKEAVCAGERTISLAVLLPTLPPVFVIMT